ncbi:MAG TPA: citramalate synthase [Clostridia bacterium]|nr:citramalate synthase [Clostridia bacterium]
MKIELLDSTLRDGAQAEGISFSVEDKLNIVRTLDDLGITYIEAGNPGSNPKDIEFFERAANMGLKNSQLVAFGSTRRKNTSTQDDPNVLSLLAAGTSTVSIFGKSSDFHAIQILGTTLEENLEMIKDTVSFFKKHGKTVIFDAEHYFDGYASNPQYALSALRAAVEAGADKIVLCDTNGGTYPAKINKLTQEVVNMFPALTVGIHCHNDADMAVAGSLMAVDAGATHVQGTFIGFGERCGNATLTSIIANLQLKMGYEVLDPANLARLAPTARYIAEISNIILPGSMPYVGMSAFAHKAGMHADGVSKATTSFEHVDPESVGNERRFLLSEIAGRTAILKKINSIFPEIKKDSPEAAAILAELKELERQGYQFEGAESSFELMVRKRLGKYKSFFELVSYKIIEEYPGVDNYSSTATIKIRVNGVPQISAAEGDGPVHALDKALRLALETFYPSLKEVHLTDYKVRVMEPQHATGAKVRVLIQSTDGESLWSTVGVSTDIIEASWIALVDSIDYKLLKDQERKKRS